MNEPARPISPQEVLGTDLLCAGRITEAYIVPQDEQVPRANPTDPPTDPSATEGPAGDVRYSAEVCQPPTAWQDCQVGIKRAVPAGRPSDDVVVQYAKKGQGCLIWVPASGDPELYILTEKIRFRDCAQAAPNPGVFFVEPRT